MSLYRKLAESISSEEPVTQVTVISTEHPAFGRKLLYWPDGRTEGTLGADALDRASLEQAQSPGVTRNVTIAETGPDETKLDDQVELFVEVFSPLPKLIIVGAVHVASHLVHFAQRLGFRTIVVDARAVFATQERFGHADELIVGWPSEVLEGMRLHDNTYCVFLSHDPKLDDPALAVALAAPVRYVGALGSKRTHAKRVDSLSELGVAPEAIERIHAPIGLDLGGRRPEEIAVAIAAQLVQARAQRL